MSRSKCISFKNQVGSQWQEINKAAVLAGSIFVLIFGMVSAILTGDFGLYKDICMPENAPVGFVFIILWTCMYILIGGVLGAVTASCDKSKSIYKYRGLLYFCSMLALCFLWPLVFFKAGLFFVAVIILCAMIALTFFSLVCFFRIYSLCGVLIFVYWLWLVYLLYFNLAALFLN